MANDAKPAATPKPAGLKPYPKSVVITENGGLRQIDREKQRQAA